MKAAYEVICDIGCVRANNEDMAYAAGRIIRDNSASGDLDLSSEKVAFSVADGMGGYEGGEIASEIVTRSFAAFMKDLQNYKPLDISLKLKVWAIETNRMVLSTASLRPELSEMGTTFTGLIFSAGKFWLINIGDSRCYRLRDGELTQVSVDHSERQRTGDPAVPSNIIYNFMGNETKEFFSNISSFEPLEGDEYLLCSDGLSDLVDDAAILENFDSADSLVDLAKRAGGRDNITVLILRL